MTNSTPNQDRQASADPGPTRTREQAIDGFTSVLAQGLLAAEQMTPREQAEAAWTPTTSCSVDELEDRIRIRRGLAPIHGSDATSVQARRAKKGGADS